MKPIDREKLLEWISVRLQQHREDKLIVGWDKLTEHAYFIGCQAEINHLKTALKSGHFDIDPPVPDIQPGDKVRHHMFGDGVAEEVNQEVYVRACFGKVTGDFHPSNLEVIDDD